MDIVEIHPKNFDAAFKLSEDDRVYILIWAKEILRGAPYTKATFTRDLSTNKFGAPSITFADCKSQYDKNRRRYYETKVTSPDFFKSHLGKWVSFFSDGSAFSYVTAGQAREDREVRNDPDAFVICVGFEDDDE